jgi:hypothetical protein
MKLIAAIIALTAAAILAPLLFVMVGDAPPAAPPEGLPWQIDVLPDGGTQVFGLAPGASTIGDARQRFGPNMQLAIVAAPGQPGSLEAYFESVSMGFVTGKLILTAEMDAATVARMRERAAKAEFMESTTRRYTLAAGDVAPALAAAIRAITFIPSANLDADVILERFGTPAERVRSNEHIEHFLYPGRGLDLALDGKGKEVLQYVAPREFERLREPLRALPQ